MAKRKLMPVFITMPPDERTRLALFLKTVDRPMSWIVRDAVRAYLDAVENDPATMAALRVKPKPDLSRSVPYLQQGRPPPDADAPKRPRGRPRKVQA